MKVAGEKNVSAPVQADGTSAHDSFGSHTSGFRPHDRAVPIIFGDEKVSLSAGLIGQQDSAKIGGAPENTTQVRVALRVCRHCVSSIAQQAAGFSDPGQSSRRIIARVKDVRLSSARTN